jgi:hypothetical protein
MFQNQLYCLLFFILLLIENGLVKEDNKKEEEFMIVNEAVVDLRNKPTILPVNYEINNDQLTQLLFNEFVIISTKNNNKDKTNKFLFVEVPDQPNFLNETWTIYSGWIENKKLSKIQSKPNYNLAVKVISANIYKRSCYPIGCIPSDIYITISLGTYLEGIHYQNGWWSVLLPPNSNGLKYGYILESNVHWLPNVKQLPLNELRKKMVETGNTMLGWYYLWGGRSSFLQYLWDSNKQVTGVDCSGLVSLIYKVWGIITPRDAHPMFLKTQNVSNPIFLEPGDLFFFADIPRPSNTLKNFFLKKYKKNLCIML